MNFIKKNKWFLLTIISTIVVMFLIFGLNNTYPFGEDVFPFMDFDSNYVPFYYRLWDLLHGYGSIFYDWNLGTGLNTFGGYIINSMFFPSSLLIVLFPRSFIPYALSFILIIKYVIIAIIFYAVINKVFPKLDGCYKYVFSLLYVFSGWGLLMMTNIIYLDVVALFPLLVLGYYYLLKEGKWKLYVIIFTLMFIFNYYMSYQILFFIAGTTIISLIVLDIKDKMKKAVLIAGLTALALGVSCFVLLPSIYQSFTSYRATGLAIEYEYDFTLFTEKAVYLFTLGIPFVLSFKQLFVKKDKKLNIFFCILLLYLLLPVFVESINAIWHTGLHSGFPLRQSFIISFVLIIGSLYYLDKNYKNKNKYSFVNLISFLMVIGLIIIMSFSFYNVITSKAMSVGVDTSQFICTLIIFILFIIGSLLLFKLDKKYFKICLVFLGIFNTILFSIFYMVRSVHVIKAVGITSNTSINTYNIGEDFNIPDDNYNYVDVYDSLNINSPFILKRPSMNNRLHFVKSNELLFNEIFGYRYKETVVKSSGGTLLSNALLQNKYFITSGNLNDVFYELIESHDNYNLYKSKYNFNYIIPYSGKVFDEDSGSYLMNTNKLYQTLFDTDKDIIHIENIKDKDNIYKYTFVPNKTYYMVVDFDYVAEKGVAFSLGDIVIQNELMYIDSVNSKVYINFRVGEKQKLELEKDEFLVTNVEVGYIDDKEYINFWNSLDLFDVDVSIDKNTKTYRFTTEEDTNILIPVNYDDAMKVYVNGEEVKYKCNAINMISIKVNKGDTEVVLKYIPKYFNEGIIISIVCIVLLILLFIFKSIFKLLDYKYILYPLFGIVCLVGLIFIIRVYILFWI